MTKHLNDEDNEVFADNFHSCEYYEIEEMKNKFSKSENGFSTYYHNISSITGHWEDVLDIRGHKLITSSQRGGWG